MGYRDPSPCIYTVCSLFKPKLFYHSTSTSQTGEQTERQTTCHGNTALCSVASRDKKQTRTFRFCLRDHSSNSEQTSDRSRLIPFVDHKIYSVKQKPRAVSLTCISDQCAVRVLLIILTPVYRH